MAHSVEGHLKLDLKEYDRMIRIFVPGYESMLSLVADTLASLFPKKLQVLDLGTGTGALAFEIAKRIPHAELELWDIDKKMLEIARGRLDIYKSRVHFVEKSFEENLPECDAIVASFSLHHFKERVRKQKTFDEIYRALRSGGIFLNADQTVNDNKELSRLTYANWSTSMRSHGLTQDQVNQHFADWEREDYYFPLYEELASLAESGFHNPECFWRQGPSTVYGAIK